MKKQKARSSSKSTKHRAQAKPPTHAPVREFANLEDIPLQPGKKNAQDGPADRGLMNQSSTVPGELGHQQP